jgi:hypothetical protein
MGIRGKLFHFDFYEHLVPGMAPYVYYKYNLQASDGSNRL